tara:strand:+ start:262 stop:519 length:258 start_codon:yes stop_codon:yes gene_type:complete
VVAVVEEKDHHKEETQTTVMDMILQILMVDLVAVAVPMDQTQLAAEQAELTEILVVLVAIQQIIEVVLAVVVLVVKGQLEAEIPL